MSNHNIRAVNSTQLSAFQPTPQALMNLWRNNDSEPPYFTNFQNSLKYPREEGFFDMVQYTCLPTFKLCSMTFVLIVMNTIYYIISLLYGDIQYGGSLLEANQNVNKVIIQSLFSLGMLYAYYIKYKFEYQRFLTSLLLYNNFVGYASAQMAIAVFGSYVQRLLGWKKLWMIGLLGGAAGTLFSGCLNSSAHVNGSSIPSTYIGILFGYTTMKWSSWSYAGSGRWQMVWIQIFAMLLLLWEAHEWEINDESAILMSFLMGYLLSWVFVRTLLKNDEEEYEDNRCLMIMAIFVILLYFGIAFYYFYMVANPLLLSI